MTGFGDIEAADVFDADDHLIDWSQVHWLAERIEMVNAIRNDHERRAAARRLIEDELGGVVR